MEKMVDEHKRLAKKIVSEKEKNILYRTIAKQFPNGGIAVFDNDFRFALVEGKNLISYDIKSNNLEGENNL
ncbi:hypothetical protein [Leptospira yasudae]|uniref:hypothetical protein n=1 Tax=Leptospira yasudae TaxID=2202201 RepID=UPI001090E852|nr:hypothetical protein [Leptospira yasudae]TGL81422.1 hypothetical protein EHQ72_05755 [Leptospira yasudae]